jgi:hypothetical protein
MRLEIDLERKGEDVRAPRRGRRRARPPAHVRATRESRGGLEGAIRVALTLEHPAELALKFEAFGAGIGE